MLKKVYNLQSPEANEEAYDEWATKYDHDTIEEMGYVAPQTAADKLAATVAAGATVLDAGCGTGQVGELLAGYGFKTIDGLDISTSMLEVARGRKVYRDLHKADLTQKLPLDDDRYDAIVCVGTFTSGHVGPDALDEMVRVLRPGAPIVATVLDEIWEPQDFPSAIDRLERSGALRRIEIENSTPYRTAEGATSRLCVLTVA